MITILIVFSLLLLLLILLASFGGSITPTISKYTNKQINQERHHLGSSTTQYDHFDQPLVTMETNMDSAWRNISSTIGSVENTLGNSMGMAEDVIGNAQNLLGSAWGTTEKAMNNAWMNNNILSMTSSVNNVNNVNTSNLEKTQTVTSPMNLPTQQPSSTSIPMANMSPTTIKMGAPMDIMGFDKPDPITPTLPNSMTINMKMPDLTDKVNAVPSIDIMATSIHHKNIEPYENFSFSFPANI